MVQVEKSMVKVPLTFFLRDPNHNYPIYLRIGERFIQFSQNSRMDLERLERIQKSNVEYIFLTPEDYQRYINSKIAYFKEFKINDKTSLDLLLSLYEDHFLLLKDTLGKIGLKKHQIEIINSLQNKALEMITISIDFSNLFKEFNLKASRLSLSKSFLEAQLVVAVLSKAKIYDSISLSKINVALLIKDVLLSEEEIELCITPEMIFAEEDILNHGVNVGKIIEQSNSLELKSELVINLLHKHHEKPDGTGFPKGINFTRFEIPSAVYYLVNQFVEILSHHEFKPYVIKEAAKKVLKENMKYGSSTNFCKALQIFSLTILQKDFLFE